MCVEQTVRSKCSKAGLAKGLFNRAAIPSAFLEVSMLES